MEYLFKKLNYRDQDRICVMNCSNGFMDDVRRYKPGLNIDTSIDAKYLYDFCIVFVTMRSEVDNFAALTIHNLAEDGILWFVYPKKSSRKYSSELSRDEGWDSLNNHGFDPVRAVAIDDDWSALRFRNNKYIKRSVKHRS